MLPLFSKQYSFSITISINSFSFSLQSKFKPSCNNSCCLILSIHSFHHYLCHFCRLLKWRSSRLCSSLHCWCLTCKILFLYFFFLISLYGNYMNLWFRYDIKIFLDTNFMHFRSFFEIYFFIFFRVLFFIITTIPLSIWICPTPIIVIKYSRSILWMHRWCLWSFRHIGTTMSVSVSMLTLSTRMLSTTMIVTPITRTPLTHQHCFSLNSCLLPLFLMIIKHHTLLLIQGLQYIPLLIHLLLLYHFNLLFYLIHFTLLYLISHILKLWV